MNKPNSYENVMKELEEVNDLLETPDDPDSEAEESFHGDKRDFRTEYAFESLTERHTAFKRRYSHA